MRIKVIIMGLVYFVISNKCFAQEPNCSLYRTGNFELFDSTLNKSFRFVRNDLYQIELGFNNDTVAIFNIIWKNDCEYILLIKSGTKEMLDMYKNRKFNIKIIETLIDSYKFEATLEGYDFILNNKAKKIKN